MVSLQKLLCVTSREPVGSQAVPGGTRFEHLPWLLMRQAVQALDISKS